MYSVQYMLGAEIVDGSVRASGNASTVQITAADQISLGSRGQTTTAYAGVIRATGNITLNGGSGYGDTTYPGMGLWVDANSTVESFKRCRRCVSPHYIEYNERHDPKWICFWPKNPVV